jgi:hypothetical protein
MREEISGEYDASPMLERSASSIEVIKYAFTASAFSTGVVVISDSMTRLRTDKGVDRGGRESCLVFAHSASDQMQLLIHLVSATACLNCAALAFMTASSLGLSASRYAIQASAEAALQTTSWLFSQFLISWLSSIDH